MYAAARGDEPAVLRLLKAGASRWVKDNEGNVAAFWADKFGFSTLAILLKHDPQKIFVHDVIRKNYFPGVVALFKQNVDPNLVRRIERENVVKSAHNNGNNNHNGAVSDGVTVMSAGGEDGGTGTVTVTGGKGKMGEDMHAVVDGETPLIVAARYNRLEVMTLLLKAPEILIDLPDAQGW